MEVGNPSIELIHVVGKGFSMRLSFESQFALVNDIEAKWPCTVSSMKGVVHVIEQHRYFTVEILLTLTSIIQSFFECCWLIHTRNGLTYRPLIACMRLS